MLRRSWKPLAGATVLLGAPAYLYYTKTRPSHQSSFELPVRVRGPDGKPTTQTRTLAMLSKPEADAHLRAHTSSTTRTLANGRAVTYTTAQVAANAPIEDAHTAAMLARADAVSRTGDAGELLFFSVFDGHGGYHTSRLLSRILVPAVALELQSLAEEPEATGASKVSILTSTLQSVFGTKGAASPKRFDADPFYVSLAIQTAFSNVDSELINAPLKLLAANVDAKARANGILPDLSQHPMAMATMQPAMSGSCAIMALVDTAHNNLYVANTGDARAVAGYWDEASDGSGKGSWRVEVLSEDQTGRNPSELARVQSEHPPEEAPYVIQRGRILGGLEPSRAFGDARYKWPKEIQSLLSQAFTNSKPLASAPAALKTPPYVTAQPVVTHMPLSAPLSAPSGAKSQLRFLVLATDGLWDRLSSEEAASLVAGHLAGLSGPIPHSSLPHLVPATTGTAGIDGKAGKDRGASPGVWSFEDANLSVHLIRNAFGGAQDEELRRLLSIPPPLARNWRDDVTVTVVVFPQEGVQPSLAGSPPVEKARL